METIYNHLFPDVWKHIYTDGSKLDTNHVAGIRIFCEHFSYYAPLGTDKIVFGGEVEAIKVSLTI